MYVCVCVCVRQRERLFVCIKVFVCVKEHMPVCVTEDEMVGWPSKSSVPPCSRCTSLPGYYLLLPAETQSSVCYCPLYAK